MDWKQTMKELTAEDEKIALVELEIARLQVQVADMRKSRNRLVPFCRLPSEILGRIFLQTQVPKHSTLSEGSQDAYIIQSEESQNASLHDFGYDDEWEKAISICSHVYRVCLNTPELWAHVDLAWPTPKIERHMSLSKTHQLAVLWIPERVQTSLGLDVAVGSACFQRASAANIMIKTGSTEQVSSIIRTIKQSAPGLSTFHFDMDGRYWPDEHNGTSVLDLIDLYPTLTELFLGHLTLLHSISKPLVHLSRLHISVVQTDYNLQSVLDTLRKTPNLTELVIDNISQQDDDHQDVPPEDGLTLEHLRKLRLEASYSFVHRFLMVLSPHMSEIQELHIHPAQGRQGHELGTMPSDIFGKVATLWTSISSLPLPPATLTWLPILNYMSSLEIQTPSNVIPTLGLRVSYRDEDVPLHKHHGLKIDTIEINHFHAYQFAEPWTNLLDPITDVLAPRLTCLAFQICTLADHRLEHWIQQRKSEGCIIDKVMFNQCGSIVESSHHDPSTLSEYEDLKKSGLVEEVEWMHETRSVLDLGGDWE
jgi:hypothetical protein